MSLGKETTFTHMSFHIFAALIVQNVVLWTVSLCSLVGESSLEIEIGIMLQYKWQTVRDLPQLKQQVTLESE